MENEKEVKKVQFLIDNYNIVSENTQQRIDNILLGIYCFIKNSEEKAETLSAKQLELVDALKKQLTNDQKKFISNLFLKKVLNIDVNEPYITLSELKSIYADGIYMAFEELLEIKKVAFEAADSDLLNFVEHLLRKKLYYDTVEDAEKALEHNESIRSNDTSA